VKTIGVIGAGPAGIMAALHASGEGTHVWLFESNPKIGKKLLITGAGRCNITNLDAAPSRYTCADPHFLDMLFQETPPKALLKELKSLGIPTTSTPDGWCYPLSESAANVVELLLAALQAAGVHIQLNARIKSIRRVKKGFSCLSDQGNEFTCDQLVLAFGGKAQPKLGADGSLFSEVKKLGHSIIPLLPALAPLIARHNPLHALQGVRLDAGVRLWKNDQWLGESQGNLIITEWGFNGPAVMDISHWVSRNTASSLILELDLLAFHKKAFNDLLNEKRNSTLPLRILLGAIFPNKVPAVLLALAGINETILSGQLSEVQLSKLKLVLTGIRIPIDGTRGFEYAQLKTGGVPVTEVHPVTMESRVVSNLFLTGEVLDVVGPCGGYNLHFAFASGMLAGKAIKRTER
jgi:predicted Rossmann fold flavoprotein